NGDFFSSDSFRALVAFASTSDELHTVYGHEGENGFRAMARPLAAVGRTYTLVVLQSLHPQREMMEDIRNTFLWAIPIALILASIGGYFLERIETSFEQQRRFMADASHELRTPVAILRGETEVTLSQSERTPGEYRETLAVLRDESQRLARIIEDLFTLTRAD